MSKKKIERLEALMRIVVLIITGIILCIWRILIVVLSIIHWIIVIIGGKRIKGIAKFCEIWNTQFYDFLIYITFVHNKRPFPFNSIEPSLTKFER